MLPTLRASGRRVRAAAAPALWAAGLLLSALVFVPWLPSPATDGVEHQLHFAALQGWSFGHDVVTTYGPLGALALPFYEPETYPALLVANLAGFSLLALSLRWFATTLLRRAPSPLWFFGVLTLPCLATLDEWCALLFAPYVLVLALALTCCLGDPRGTKAAVTKQLIVSALSAFVLCKGLFAVLVLAGVAAVAADDVARRRAFPWCLLNLVGTLAACWLGTGQSFLAIGPYVVGSGEIAAGYREAMATWRPVPTPVTVLFFALSGFCVVPSLACAWGTLGRRAILPVGVLLLAVYSVFLHGFVRKGGGHTVSACVTLATLALFLTPWLWSRARSFEALWPHRLLSGAAIAAPCLGIALIAACWSTIGMGSFAALLTRPRDFCRLLGGQGLAGLRSRRDERQARLRAGHRLPRIEGTVEMPGGDPDVVLANGLRFRPRPTLVSYAAYTPYLTKLNAAYLEAPEGPAAVLFPFEPLDSRYPTIADNRSFLSMMSHFRLEGRTGDLLLFLRRPRPQRIELVPVAQGTARLGQGVRVPPTAGPVWAKLDVRSTVANRLAAALFKPAPLVLEVVADRFAARNRLLPTLARDGFLLSPYFTGLDAVAKLYGSPRVELAASDRVLAFRVAEDAHPMLPEASYYEDELGFSLFEVVVQEP